MQINLSKAMKRFKAVDFTLNPNMRKQIDQVFVGDLACDGKHLFLLNRKRAIRLSGVSPSPTISFKEVIALAVVNMSLRP